MNPKVKELKTLLKREWRGAQGLAEDVQYYGQWMREEAEKRIGHLYPKVEVTKDIAKERPDLMTLIGEKFTVIAWIWARTVPSPDPAFSDVHGPIVSSFLLSAKVGKEAWVEPTVDKETKTIRYDIRRGSDKAAITLAKQGTKS